MLFVIDGRVFVLVPCDCCRRTARIRWPERWRTCDWCSARVTAGIEAGIGTG